MQITVKLSTAHVELLERLRSIYGVGRTNLLYRAVIEHVAVDGRHPDDEDVPGIPSTQLRTARLDNSKKTQHAVADLLKYAQWLSETLVTTPGAPKSVRIHDHTRRHLIRRLARWPTPDARPTLRVPSTPAPQDTSSTTLSLLPQALFIPPAQVDAFREAAKRIGSISDLVRAGLDSFAAKYELTEPGATSPTFPRFPPPPLATALRSFEEPCLAILYAMELIDRREERPANGAHPEFDALFEALTPSTTAESDDT